MLLYSPLFFVIVIEIAILALSFSIHKSIGMRASIGVAISTIFVVAMIAHTFRVVLLGSMRAHEYFHALAFEIGFTILGILLSIIIVASLRVTS